MNHRDSTRARRTTWLIAAASVLLLSAAAFACRERLRERYFIWRLETGSEAEQDAAAASLGVMGSALAIPALLEVLDDRVERLETIARQNALQQQRSIVWIWAPGSGSADPLIESLRKIVHGSFGESRPHLIRAIEIGDFHICSAIAHVLEDHPEKGTEVRELFRAAEAGAWEEAGTIR